jgi:short-subunit dehydrogenase
MSAPVVLVTGGAQAGAGSIINVSSTYGRTGGPGAAVYVASKHAVEGLTIAVDGGKLAK